MIRPRFFITVFVSLLLPLLFLSGPAGAEMIAIADEEMDGVSAKGTISVGPFTSTDNHQFDSSLNKGAIIMTDSAMQNANGNIIVNATQSAISTGTINVGDINSSDTGGNITVTNTNESTSFIGGF